MDYFFPPLLRCATSRTHATLRRRTLENTVAFVSQRSRRTVAKSVTLQSVPLMTPTPHIQKVTRFPNHASTPHTIMQSATPDSFRHHLFRTLRLFHQPVAISCWLRVDMDMLNWLRTASLAATGWEFRSTYGQGPKMASVSAPNTSISR